MNPASPDRILNTYDQLLAARAAGLPDIAIVPRHLPSCSRGGGHYTRGWKVWRPGYDLWDKSEPTPGPLHPDANCRIFDEGRRDIRLNWRLERSLALMDAKQWASGRYKVTAWKRNRQGDYIDARVHAGFPLPPSPRKGGK
jgi:hypothetical protein